MRASLNVVSMNSWWSSARGEDKDRGSGLGGGGEGWPGQKGEGGDRPCPPSRPDALGRSVQP